MYQSNKRSNHKYNNKRNRNHHKYLLNLNNYKNHQQYHNLIIKDHHKYLNFRNQIYHVCLFLLYQLPLN